MQRELLTIPDTADLDGPRIDGGGAVVGAVAGEDEGAGAVFGEAAEAGEVAAEDAHGSDGGSEINGGASGNVLVHQHGVVIDDLDDVTRSRGPGAGDKITGLQASGIDVADDTAIGSGGVSRRGEGGGGAIGVGGGERGSGAQHEGGISRAGQAAQAVGSIRDERRVPAGITNGNRVRERATRTERNTPTDLSAKAGNRDGTSESIGTGKGLDAGADLVQSAGTGDDAGVVGARAIAADRKSAGTHEHAGTGDASKRPDGFRITVEI